MVEDRPVAIEPPRQVIHPGTIGQRNSHHSWKAGVDPGCPPPKQAQLNHNHLTHVQV